MKFSKDYSKYLIVSYNLVEQCQVNIRIIASRWSETQIEVSRTLFKKIKYIEQ